MPELAQVNVSVLRAPLRHRTMAGFVAAFDSVARLAEQSPGFVWHLQSDSGHTIRDGAGLQVVNVSVWRDYPSLHDFVYAGGHRPLLSRRDEWFLPTPQPSTALWWQPDGVRPGLDEALDRLRRLRADGPTEHAFSLTHQFTAEGIAVGRRFPDA